MKAAKLLQEIKSLKYTQEDFDKFENKKNPLYGIYRNRSEEKADMTGFNKGVDATAELLINRNIIKIV